jgi:hypothetical protein
MADAVPTGAVAAVLGPEGEPVGVGVLVGEDALLTCAHVVNAALGRDSRSQDQPSETIIITFPLLSQGGDVIAVVERWFPPPREGAAGDDLAGLRLLGPAPPTARAARLSVDAALPGRDVRVYGYPGRPPRPNGAWVAATVRGPVGNGYLQLDSGVDSALRVQPGYSGSPVFDNATGRVVGLLAAAPGGTAADRDSYAIGTHRLRLAWPERLERRAGSRRATDRGERRSVGREALTVLHLSDPQFGRNHLFGGNGLTEADRDRDSLFARLHDDLEHLAEDPGLRPDLVVVTGDLAEWGLRTEFEQVTAFLAELSEAAEVPRRHIAVVPGNHDVNRKACEAYFRDQGRTKRSRCRRTGRSGGSSPRRSRASTPTWTG